MGSIWKALWGPAPDATDALNADINIQTQASILQSNALALRTIENLGLENTRAFNPPAGPVRLVGGTLFRGDSSKPDMLDGDCSAASQAR